MWKIKDAEYIEDASTLRGPMLQYFPDRFEFAHLDVVKGIWVVVPDSTRNCPTPTPDIWASSESIESPEYESREEESDLTSSTTPRSHTKPTTSELTTTTSRPLCYTSSNATFRFTSSAQLLKSASIKYCFGGSAQIQVGGPRDKPFEMAANHKYLDNWIEEKVPLNGNSMVLEAQVFGKGDYILIDKVTVSIMEPSPRPGRSSTTMEPSNSTTQEPSPASGQARTAIGSLVPIFILIAVMSFNLKQM